MRALPPARLADFSASVGAKASSEALRDARVACARRKRNARSSKAALLLGSALQAALVCICICTHKVLSALATAEAHTLHGKSGVLVSLASCAPACASAPISNLSCRPQSVSVKHTVCCTTVAEAARDLKNALLPL